VARRQNDKRNFVLLTSQPAPDAQQRLRRAIDLALAAACRRGVTQAALQPPEPGSPTS